MSEDRRFAEIAAAAMGREPGQDDDPAVWIETDKGPPPERFVRVAEGRYRLSVPDMGVTLDLAGCGRTAYESHFVLCEEPPTR